MKKIIIYKKDKGAFMPIDSFLKDKEKIEHAIINKQNKTKLKTLPLSINLMLKCHKQNYFRQYTRNTLMQYDYQLMCHGK